MSNVPFYVLLKMSNVPFYVPGLHGLPYDESTGLIYARARYYHPKLGRWISRDPKGYVDGGNLYEAFGSNPIRFTDPMGTDLFGWIVLDDISYSAGDYFRATGIKGLIAPISEYYIHPYKRGYEMGVGICDFTVQSFKGENPLQLQAKYYIESGYKLRNYGPDDWGGATWDVFVYSGTQVTGYKKIEAGIRGDDFYFLPDSKAVIFTLTPYERVLSFVEGISQFVATVTLVAAPAMEAASIARVYRSGRAGGYSFSAIRTRMGGFRGPAFGGRPGIVAQVSSLYRNTRNRLGNAGTSIRQASGSLYNRFRSTRSAPNTGTGGWQNLPGGVRVKQVGNYWVKEVNPGASRLAQWWGRGSLEAQARGLNSLGDMAPSHLFQNGKLITKNVGEYVPGNFWKTWAEGAWRLRTPFNDIRPRNIGGPNNLIFDPAKHPLQQAAEATAAGGTGAYIYLKLTEEE